MKSEGMGDTPCNSENNATNPSTPPTLPPEPSMNEKVATVAHWVSAAFDGLADQGFQPDEDSIHETLSGWARAPDISRNQIAEALKRRTSETPLFDF